MEFQKGTTNFGGIFSLSPESETQLEGSPFPDGYVSLVSSNYSYLLSAPDGDCVSSSDLGLAKRYDGGILCKKPLRALKIYSRGLKNNSTVPSLLVEAWFNSAGVTSHTSIPASSSQNIAYHQIGDNVAGNGGAKRQGFSLPVIPSPNVSYRLSLTTGDGSIPHDWVVEFNDPVVGNRWGVEYLQLELQGRPCGDDGLVSSQHDRRFIFDGVDFLPDNAWGNHGACVVAESQPQDMPTSTCAGSSDQGKD